MRIGVKVKGSFKNTERFFDRVKDRKLQAKLDRYGMLGVIALALSTPVRSGKTASSWSYKLISRSGYVEIIWTNDNINKGYNIAMLIQYGHGTRNGGYVQGLDYINPAMRPVFEAMADDIWKEVTG